MKRSWSYIFHLLAITILSFYYFAINLGYALTPWDISNQVFFLDAQNIDWDWNDGNEPVNNTNISEVIDIFASHTWSQTVWSKRPIYKTNSINQFPSIAFDWSDDALYIHDDLDINTDAEYDEKSFALIIKTWTDITSFQSIYEQWWKEKGFSFQIEWWKLYAWVYNTIDWTTWSTLRKIDFWTIAVDTIYTIVFVYDEINDEIRWYLNWNLATTLSVIEKQKTHWICMFDSWLWCSIFTTWTSIWIWWVLNDVQKLSDWTEIEIYEWHHFGWYIWEIVQWNTWLTDTESLWIHDYLYTKWYWDITPPIIVSTNFWSGSILPWWNHDITFNYDDFHEWSSWIDISDLWINYNDNIAPHATITHTISTTWWVPPHPQSIVNGIKRTDWAYNYEYHSNWPNAFIEFNWNSAQKVWAMRIYNRVLSCCGHRLTNATIKLYNSSNILVYTHTLWDTTWIDEIDVNFEELWEIHDVSRLRLDSVWTDSAINIREIEIFSFSENITLKKWDGTDWWNNIATTWFDLWTKSITTLSSTYPTNDLSFWKYKASFLVHDINGNVSEPHHLIFYIDEPEMNVSTSSTDIWILSSISKTYAPDITVTVKTIWVPFKVKLQKNQTLTYTPQSIPYFTGSVWFGFDKDNNSSLDDIWANEIIGSSSWSVSANGLLNTYTYTVNMWALIDAGQIAWDYSWLIDFWIEYDYLSEYANPTIASSCKTLVEKYGTHISSWTYTINPGSWVIDVYCDMDVMWWGWTMVKRIWKLWRNWKPNSDRIWVMVESGQMWLLSDLTPYWSEFAKMSDSQINEIDFSEIMIHEDWSWDRVFVLDSQIDSDHPIVQTDLWVYKKWTTGVPLMSTLNSMTNWCTKYWIYITEDTAATPNGGWYRSCAGSMVASDGWYIHTINSNWFGLNEPWVYTNQTWDQWVR